MIDHQEIEKLDGTEVFILLEYCPNGTLFDLIEQKCKLGFEGITDETRACRQLSQIAQATSWTAAKKLLDSQGGGRGGYFAIDLLPLCFSARVI